MRGALLALLLLASGPASAGPLPCAADAASGAIACFESPTTRYGHDVLGGGGEWGALALTLADGTEARVELPPELVFEDLAPRLFDLDGAGAPEIVVVRSDVAEGAQLAVYALDRGALRLIAATPTMGARNRWLAPAAIADLDGDGRLDIAFVEKPHVGGVLQVWSFAPGGLMLKARIGGLSNHRIGDAFITGFVRVCGGRPEMVMPDFAWKRAMAVRFDGGALKARPLGDLPSPEAIDRYRACAG